MVNGQFRSNVWDPFMIICQIIAVQAVFYSFLGIWQFVHDVIVGRPLSIQQIFDTSEADFFTTIGRIQLSVFLTNSLTSAVALWFIVQRAKRCLDFAVTAHFFHFICCCCVSGFPTCWVWWVKTVLSITITAVLSEYLCMRYELKPIPVTHSGAPWIEERHRWWFKLSPQKNVIWVVCVSMKRSFPSLEFCSSG